MGVRKNLNIHIPLTEKYTQRSKQRAQKTLKFYIEVS